MLTTITQLGLAGVRLSLCEGAAVMQSGVDLPQQVVVEP